MFSFLKKTLKNVYSNSKGKSKTRKYKTKKSLKNYKNKKSCKCKKKIKKTRKTRIKGKNRKQLYKYKGKGGGKNVSQIPYGGSIPLKQGYTLSSNPGKFGRLANPMPHNPVHETFP